MVRVADVGQARIDFKEPTRLVRSRGQRVLAINAQREVGANVIATMAGFRERLQWIRDEVIPVEERRLGFEVGTITFEQVYDQTVYIDQALAMVRQNLWVGGILASLVLLLFLRSVRSTLIIALAIPISVVGTFAVMTVLGRNINVISLAGLAFAVGMVVDNAIVVLENIDRHRRMGKDAAKAALDATREVWGAVLASTLTTVAVFIPVLMVQEEAGQLFRDIALAICAAVTLSLIVSITVIPAAAARWLGQKRVADVESSPRTWSRRFVHFIELATRSWLARLSVASSLTLASVVLSLWLMPPSDYLPGGNRNLIFAMLFPPPGYNLEQKESLGLRVEETVRPFWEAGLGKRDPSTLPKVASMDFATGQMQSIDVPPLENFFFVSVQERLFMGGYEY